jgi:hypothetical protein
MSHRSHDMGKDSTDPGKFSSKEGVAFPQVRYPVDAPSLYQPASPRCGRGSA